MDSTHWIGAREATARLGVKPQTLYAYVSRGVLSRRSRDGRTSEFDAAEVDRLASRARVGRRARAGTIDVAIATSISRISDDGVWFRGRPLSDLVGRACFERVAEWLWRGVDEQCTPWRAPDALPMTSLGPQATATDVLVSCAGVVASNDADRGDLSPDALAAKGRALIAAFARSVPATRPRRPIDDSIAAALLARLVGRRATAPEVAAIDAVLVILSDHDLASSTLAARVAASTRADAYAVVTAGLSSGAGPLHLSATTATVRLLDEVRRAGDAPSVLDAYLRCGELIPGFGHRVYTGLDPRLPLVLDIVRAVPGAAERLAIVDDVIAAAAVRFDKQANIDLALGGMVHALGLARHSTDYMFAIARTVGWLAHAIEEYQERPLRFRPRAVYVGP